jgi:hypothetical protein
MQMYLGNLRPERRRSRTAKKVKKSPSGSRRRLTGHNNVMHYRPASAVLRSGGSRAYVDLTTGSGMSAAAVGWLELETPRRPFGRRAVDMPKGVLFVCA